MQFDTSDDEVVSDWDSEWWAENCNSAVRLVMNTNDRIARTVHILSPRIESRLIEDIHHISQRDRS